jgi:hypothetical protein
MDGMWGNNLGALESSRLWGKLYQTSNDPLKKAKFLKDQMVPSSYEEELMAASELAVDPFAGDMGTDPDKLRELLYRTAMHESSGGKYVEQMGGGPARGWYQVEPSTAMDLLKNSRGLFGSNAKQYIKDYTGLSISDLRKMNEQELGDQIRWNPYLGGMFAAANYLSKAKAKGELKALK